MPTHTNDFANSMKAAIGNVTKNVATDAPGTQHYHGTDLGEFVDFSAVHKLLMAAVKKLPKGERPENLEGATLTVVVHSDKTGSAWIMDKNPYKTWAWIVVFVVFLANEIAKYGSMFYV